MWLTSWTHRSRFTFQEGHSGDPTEHRLQTEFKVGDPKAS